MSALLRNGVLLGATAFTLALATIAGAWGFQVIGGYEPCALCLRQRLPYYTGVPMLALGAVLAFAAWKRLPWEGHFSAGHGRIVPALAAAVLLVGSAIFIWSTYLGGQHAGAEWGLWAVPDSCSAASLPVTSGGNLLESLRSGTASGPVNCGVAQWRLAGLSFAGWNAVISAAVVILASAAALAMWRARTGTDEPIIA